MTMVETKHINILPRLVRKAEETGSGIIIDGTTDLRTLIEVPQDSKPKLPDQYQNCIDNGGRVIIDWTGRPFRYPNHNENSAKKEAL